MAVSADPHRRLESAISDDEVRAQLARLLAHPRFASADRQRRFLEFTVEQVLAGRGEEIKEYLIALEVYGRKPDYDPKIDSIVRVEASRVRARLKEYYAADGVEDPLLIDLPKGSYVPSFARRELATASAVPAEAVARVNGGSGSTANLARLDDSLPPFPPPARVRPVSRSLVLVVALLVVAAGAAWLMARRSRSPALSIAVQPFTNLIAGEQGAAFAKGLPKDIEAALIESGALPVVTSAQHAGRAADLTLEGTLRTGGSQLRILIQLLSARDGGYIWSHSFEAGLNLPLDQQSRLAKQIQTEAEAQAVQYGQQLAAAGEARGRALALYRFARQTTGYDTDATAQRGTAAIDLLPLPELNHRISLLAQAIQIDPQFAPAHAALASYYEAAKNQDGRMLTKARESARRAIALEPRLGEAHGTLGYIYFLYDWQLAAAAAEFRAALESEPRILTLYRLHADVLSILGRHDEALAELARARLVYPAHPIVETAVATVLYNARRFAEAEAQSRRNQERFPDFHLTHWTRGLALEQQRRLPEAIAEESACLKLSPSDTRCTVAIGHMYALAGQRPRAHEILAQLRARPRHQATGHYPQALIHAALGETSAAYAELEQAFAAREPDCPYAALEPRFDGLRQQPRFQKLLAEAGLPRSQ